MKLVSKVFLLLLLAADYSAFAVQPDRVTERIDSTHVAVIKNSTLPAIRERRDRGPVNPTMILNYVSLRISPSPTQQAALIELLASQQDRSSPNYHKWLTPEQFADRFGASRQDIAKITAWLREQGFKIVDVARSRNWIAFSGTAGQIATALHSSIHNYELNGELHYANNTDVSVPKALTGVVTSIQGLDDFRWKSTIVRRRSDSQTGPGPYFSTGAGGSNYLAPYDIATIYDISPLYANGFDGSGISLAIIGQTDIYTTDINDFRTGFNLPAISLQQHLAGGCVDPGVTSDLGEADFDLEWSGAVARNSTIIYDKCDASHGGAGHALVDAISNNYAKVISFSYGACEPHFGKPNAGAFQDLIRQANVQGITVISSSGDSGAAACDQPGALAATRGMAVSLPASIPEVTAVGGTEFFADTLNPSAYWGSNGPNFGSALQYISEEPWNDTAIGGSIWASGGGRSSYFPLPPWQICQPGSSFPCTNTREVPDIAITASFDHDAYILCTAGSCSAGIANAVLNNSIAGGTSAGAPVFSGMVTLLNQYLINKGVLAKPGLSNINPSLYGNFSPSNSPFHATGPGDNIVPCLPGTPGCPTSPPFQYGYSWSGIGSNLVTGLGSPDTFQLISNWSSLTTTSLSLSSSPVYEGTPTVTLTANVKPLWGTATPTGTIDFIVNGNSQNSVILNSGIASLTYNTSNLTIGTNSISATYNPSGSFAQSESQVSLELQDFTLAANPKSVTVGAPGQSGSTMLALTRLGGFTQPVSFTCSGLPSEANCSFAQNAQGANLTITTTAPSARLHGIPLHREKTLFFATLSPGFLGLLFLGTRQRISRRMRPLTFIVILGLCSMWVSCGGNGSGSGNINTPTNPGTPIGTTQVTVTATTLGSNPLTHSTVIALAVQ